jgi:hypothetical protein
MNILNFQFSNNYSNINKPGYMYNLRKVSISHSIIGTENDITICLHFFKFFKLLYKYIKYFNKNRNYFLFEVNKNIIYLIKPIEHNINQYILELKQFLNTILKDDKITNELKILVNYFLSIIKEK